MKKMRKLREAHLKFLMQNALYMFTFSLLTYLLSIASHWYEEAKLTAINQNRSSYIMPYMTSVSQSRKRENKDWKNGLKNLDF